MRTSRVAWRMLLCLMALSEIAMAQVSTGTISGTVSDATGAVIPGVEVTARNRDTGLSRVLATNERGRYVAPQLPSGNYEVSASASGFQTEIRREITLAVGREAVVDFSLTVGAMTERVEVTGEAPLVETTTATTSGLVDETTVKELPLNGRSFTDLMDLQPNVKNLVGAHGTSPTMGYGAHFSVSGAHPNQNMYLVDGLNTSDSRVSTPGSASGNVLGTDTIREFRLLTSNYSAEFGQVSGGVMTAVTKSGDNTLRGSLFEYLRNSALDARRFFDRDPRKPQVRSSPPPFKRNQFGATFGGPIRKDRSFFFGSYEGLRERLQITQTIRVPTAAARRGFLPTGPCASGCAVGPNVQKLLNLYPLPNSTDFGNGSAEYVSAPSNPTREDFFSIRLDHTFREMHSLFGRYTFDDGKVENAQASGLFVSTEVNRYQNFTVNLTSILTPTLLNSFRAGVNRMRSGNPFRQLAEDVSPLEFISGRDPGSVSVPELSNIGPGDFRSFYSTYYQYGDDLAYTRGNHTLKFGTALQRNQENPVSFFQFNGQWSFASLVTLFQESPRQLLSTTPTADPQRGFRSWIAGAYLQDNWKVLPNLTLNLGVRFEWATVPTEVNGKIATIRNLLTDRATTVGEPFWEMNSAVAHAAPRVGLAWDPFGDGRTSVRSGVGIFQEAVRNFDYTLPGTRMPPFYVNTLLPSTAANPLIYPDIFANFARLGIPNVPPRLDTMDFHQEQPYRISWSFDIQREALPNLLVNVGYSGARGVHSMNAWGDVNSPVNVVGPDGTRYIPGTGPGLPPRRNPSFSQIRYRDTGNDSNYNALQVTVQRRWRGGFQLSSSYTWSKSIDVNSIKLSQGPEFGNADQEAYPFDTKANRGPSSWDIRHYWSMNYLYELPLGPGKTVGRNLSGVGGKLLEGWSLSGVVTAAAGPPFSPTLGFDYADAQPQTGGGGQKPDLLPGGSLNPVEGTTIGCGVIDVGQTLGGPERYFDPCVFELPPRTPDCIAIGPQCARRVFGTVGRNTISGPGLATWNFSLLKNTTLREGKSLQFRAEFFNLLNRPNFRLPNSTVFLGAGQRDPGTGRITSVATTARQIQFALKLVF